MKNIFKLSVSLFFNQFLAIVAGMMCIPFAFFLTNMGNWGHLIVLAISFGFFAYIQYKAGFTYGFHDADRRNKPDSKAYLYKGAMAGLISAIPYLAVIGVYIFSSFVGNMDLKAVSCLIATYVNIYFSMPLSAIFPNHINEIIALSVLPLTVIPCIGYIAGYVNFDVFDKICIALRIKPRA